MKDLKWAEKVEKIDHYILNLRIKPHLSQFQSKKSRLAHDSSLVRRYKYGSASKIFLIFFCVFKDLFYLKMFAFLLRTFCNSVISKIRLLSVKKSNFRSTLGARQDIFLSLFSLSNFWGPCWMSEKSNYKLALKAKKTVLRKWKILKNFFS